MRPDRDSIQSKETQFSSPTEDNYFSDYFSCALIHHLDAKHRLQNSQPQPLTESLHLSLLEMIREAMVLILFAVWQAMDLLEKPAEERGFEVVGQGPAGKESFESPTMIDTGQNRIDMIPNVESSTCINFSPNTTAYPRPKCDGGTFSKRRKGTQLRQVSARQSQTFEGCTGCRPCPSSQNCAAGILCTQGAGVLLFAWDQNSLLCSSPWNAWPYYPGCVVTHAS